SRQRMQAPDLHVSCPTKTSSSTSATKHGSEPPPLPPVRCIIKAGGAAITHKAQLETLQQEVLRRVCQSVAAAAAAIADSHCGHGPAGSSSQAGACDGDGEQGGGIVLVHGAGSFGHHPASEYGVARGPLTDPRVRQGFALTRSSVTRLNGLVVGELLAAGVSAVGLSPFGHYTASNREVSTSGVHAVAACLRSGLLPVLHGDAVLDEQLGCSILSGDTLVRELAERMRPDWVVFLTNVAGVFDRPPEEAGARLLRRILVRKDGSWRVAEVEGGSGADGVGDRDASVRMRADEHDVTGGIALKVEEAARVARLGIPVLIVQAGSEHGAAACRLGPWVASQPHQQQQPQHLPAQQQLGSCHVSSAGEGAV
ncbi:hypothetical protein Agub_g9132, partial [Astrephomene gubernaculifera]